MPPPPTHTQHGKLAFVAMDLDYSLMIPSPIQTFSRDGSNRKRSRNQELRRVSNSLRRQSRFRSWRLLRSPQLVPQSAVSLRSAIAVGPQSSAFSSQFAVAVSPAVLSHHSC